MRLQAFNPLARTSHSSADLAADLVPFLTAVARQLNAFSEGSISAIANAMTAAPTTGTYTQGDFVRNSAPVELGSAGHKYLVFGWTCIASGAPGTWREFRFLTGG